MLKVQSQRLVMKQFLAEINKCTQSHENHLVRNGYRQLVKYTNLRLRAKDDATRASLHNHMYILRFIWNYYVNNSALYRRRRYNEWRLSMRYLLAHFYITHALTRYIRSDQHRSKKLLRKGMSVFIIRVRRLAGYNKLKKQAKSVIRFKYKHRIMNVLKLMMTHRNLLMAQHYKRYQLKTIIRKWKYFERLRTRHDHSDKKVQVL